MQYGLAITDIIAISAVTYIRFLRKSFPTKKQNCTLYIIAIKSKFRLLKGVKKKYNARIKPEHVFSQLRACIKKRKKKSKY